MSDGPLYLEALHIYPLHTYMCLRAHTGAHASTRVHLTKREVRDAKLKHVHAGLGMKYQPSIVQDCLSSSTASSSVRTSRQLGTGITLPGSYFLLRGQVWVLREDLHHPHPLCWTGLHPVVCHMWSYVDGVLQVLIIFFVILELERSASGFLPCQVLLMMHCRSGSSSLSSWSWKGLLPAVGHVEDLLMM